MAFALQIFGTDCLEEQKKWVVEQFRRCFDYNTNLMVLDTEDPNTNAARIYEATRLPDIEAGSRI